MRARKEDLSCEFPGKDCCSRAPQHCATNWATNCCLTGMLVPPEILFCNMPWDRNLEAAAVAGLERIDLSTSLVSCRVSIKGSKSLLAGTRYRIGVFALAHSEAVVIDQRPGWLHILASLFREKHAGESQGAEPALQRALQTLEIRLRHRRAWRRWVSSYSKPAPIDPSHHASRDGAGPMALRSGAALR